MLVFPCSQPQRLNALEDADNLIRHIFDPQRSRALLVVTTRGNHASPDIDVDNVNLSTNGCIDIVLLDDDEISHRFSEMLEASGHKSLATYRGAARLYMPCPPAQDDDRSWAPLFYTDTAPHRHALVAHLVALSSNGTRIAAPCNGHDSRHTSLLSPPPHDIETDKFIRIRTATQAHRLTMFMLSSERRLPIVAISTPSHAKPIVNMDYLTNGLHGLAHIVQITDTDAIRALESDLDRSAWIYGSAGRIYPTGDRWNGGDQKLGIYLPNPHVSPMLLTNLMVRDTLLLVRDSLLHTLQNHSPVRRPPMRQGNRRR